MKHIIISCNAHVKLLGIQKIFRYRIALPAAWTEFIIVIIIIFLTANGFLPGGSCNTIRHNTQNNPPRSNKVQHTKLHNNKQNYITVRVTYYTQWIQLQLHLQLQYKHNSQYNINIDTIY
jgi:hypothetical protein